MKDESEDPTMELEIGTIDNRVVFHIKCELPVTKPMLLGFKAEAVDSIIETLKDAKQRVLKFDEQFNSVG
jgi:hypothetical protein